MFMSNLNINSKEFFSNYIFHPRDPSLSEKDSRKAVIASVVLGILSLGIVYLVCLIKYRNVKHILQPTGTTAAVNNMRPGGVPTQEIPTGTLDTQALRPRSYSSTRELPASDFDSDKIIEVVPTLEEARAINDPQQRLNAFELIAKNSSDIHEKNDACRILGAIYRNGVSGISVPIEPDREKAIFWLEEGIRAGDLSSPSASSILSEIYNDNSEIAPNINQPKDSFFDPGEVLLVKDALAIEEPKSRLANLEKIAKYSNNITEKRQACKEAAISYRDEEKDISQAIFWFKEAIEAGDVTDRTVGVIKSDELLAQLYIDNTDFASDTDELYRLGNQIGKLTPKGSKLLKLAANMGNPDAMYVAADTILSYYSKNRTTPQELDQAMVWLNGAAEHNHSDACELLSLCLFREEGNYPIDKDEAAKWLLLAFDNGKNRVEVGSRAHRKILNSKQEAIEYLARDKGIHITP